MAEVQCDSESSFEALQKCCDQGNQSNPKTALYCCKANTKKLTNILTQNEEIAAYNSGQSSKAGAAWSAWDKRRQASADAISTWNSSYNKRYGEWYAHYDRERKIWNSCVGWNDASNNSHHDWCQNDTGFGQHQGAGGHGCTSGWGKGECKRTHQQSHDAAVGSTLWELGAKPAPFSEGEPQDKVGSYAHQTPITIGSDINIQCCANLFNIAGTAKNNVQSCEQSINQTLQLPPPPPPPPAEETKTETKDELTFTSIQSSAKENWELTGGSSLVSFMSCFSSSLIIILLILSK
jgi:hypothetical protein